MTGKLQPNTPELEDLLDRFRAFVEGELIPIENQLLSGEWGDIYWILEKKRNLVRDLGLWLPQIPIKWGGLGLSLEEFGKVSSILGETPFGHYCFNCQAPDAGNMEILLEFGTPYQQKEFLMPLLEGAKRSCFAMTEPEFAGSNPIYMATSASKKGEDYILTGHKWFTSGADGASFVIVMALTSPREENPYKRASQLIVPTDTPGFEIIRNISVMGEKGGGWASHSEIRMDKCRIPESNLLGNEGAGFSIAQSRLGPGRIHHCMRWLGICERAFDMMCHRAATRELSPGNRLAQKQTIQNWIAESRAEINAARLMVLDAARNIDERGSYAVRMDISIIKFYCAQVLRNTLERAIQVHGALGVTDELPLAYWYRHERGAQIYDGADEVHKSRVAKLVLRKYGM